MSVRYFQPRGDTQQMLLQAVMRVRCVNLEDGSRGALTHNRKRE